MSTSEIIGELLLRWEAARQDGKNLTPEELCADCPQLTNELRRRIGAVLAMEGVLGVNAFCHERTRPLDAGDATVDIGAEVLPDIPGYEILRLVDEGGM